MSHYPRRLFLYMFVCIVNYVLGTHAYANEKRLISTDCMGCHQTQTHAWEESDHAMSMALPNQQNVRGNFNKQSVSHYSQSALFFIENGEYKATISDTRANSEETFTIKYTFGHYPLQQYLVATKPGTFQVLPFAWDARAREEGGQRWYHNYSDEKISATDRLHWRQPLQNWNGMCADCHSDELRRNYKPDINSFDTQFSGTSVGCVSCHGVMEEHLKSIQNKPASSPHTKKSDAVGQWAFDKDASTAVWKGAKRENEFMQTCFACHSFRAPLTDGFTVNDKFLNQFSPSLITPPLYHADGQINEEVFVYGSFLQSKMYARGVNCLDCHDAHTMKLKIEGNGLCLQCHAATEFNTPKHHKHISSGAGAQCVNCHMPDKVYMGVDNRRDHSFKIPLPHLSNRFNTPNACTDCHNDKSNTWAEQAIVKWYGAPATMPQAKQDLLRIRHGQNISLSAHLAIVNNADIDVISRASALALIGQSTQSLSASQLKAFTQSSHDLIRLAAARVGDLVNIQQRRTLIAPLLNDPLKSIRIAAAEVLLGLPITQQNLSVFNKAFKELSIANKSSIWRGEGRVNQGNQALKQNDVLGAQKAYQASIDIDPYFPAGYTNLADLYRAKQREDLVADVLSQGLKALPDSAEVAYSYGLHLVRVKNIEQAITYFEHAMQLNPNNMQYAYTYVLALDGNNQTTFAIAELKRVIGKYSDNQALIELGQYLAKKTNSKSDFNWFTKVNR